MMKTMPIPSAENLYTLDKLRNSTSSYAVQLREEAAAKEGGLKNIATNRSDLFNLNPYLIVAKDGWNSRDMRDPENQAHITQLAKSIAEVGVQEPLTIWMDEGKPTLTDGHCRLLATFVAIEEYGAEIRSVPVKTEPRGNNEVDRLFSQGLRNSGKRLSPLEQGRLYKRLLSFGSSEAEIARRMGVQQIQVSRYLDLVATPEAMQSMVATGEISATLALQTIGEQGAEKATEVLAQAVSVAKERGKAKATLSTVTEVVTGTKPTRAAPKKAKAQAAAKAAPMVDALIQALSDLLKNMPEYDPEENMSFDRYHKNAIAVLAMAEEEAGV
jgi:ParB family transcriptional regulator, chromosome partitioning protein